MVKDREGLLQACSRQRGPAPDREGLLQAERALLQTERALLQTERACSRQRGLCSRLRTFPLLEECPFLTFPAVCWVLFANLP